MRNSYIDKVHELREQEQVYAIAMIVRRRQPSSSKPGDKAIITADGNVHGWIGGGCTRGIVLKEALLAMQDRKPRFVSIAPDKKTSTFDNTKTYTMTCQSGGEVEVYIEPIMPNPQLIIFGTSHISMSLARIAKAIDYRVDVYTTTAESHVFDGVDHLRNLDQLVPEKINPNAYLVVCTQGEGDAQALFSALSIGSSYLSFVASRKKANAIYREVRALGASFDQLKTIKTPAGIDIHAKTPDEVAISILAEIINHYRAPSEQNQIPDVANIELQNDDLYMNPVCKIPIRKSTAKYVLDYKDEKVYFCCDGCKVSFEKDPAKYMEV
jgi:xanthine dehydrogenase accessory factor